MTKKKIGILIISILVIIFIVKFAFKDEIDNIIKNKQDSTVVKDKKNAVKRKINYKKDVIQYVKAFTRLGKFRSVNIRPVLYSWVNRKISYEYNWYINDNLIDYKERVLSSDHIHKGDKIYCIIKPKTNEKHYNQIKSEVVNIKNSAPFIDRELVPIIRSGLLEFKIDAKDVDGDKLLYSLVSTNSNSDINIDKHTGKIETNINETEVSFNGEQEDSSSSNNIIIKFKVTDSDGAEVFGSVTFNTASGSEEGE